MKIAMIGQKGIPAVCGGVEKHVEDISVRLVKLGHEVVVYTRKSHTQDASKGHQGVTLISLPGIFTKHLDTISYAFLATLHVIFDRRVDLVHYHAIGPSLMIPLIRIFRPFLPVIATHHSRDYLHGKWGKLARTMLQMGEWFQAHFAHTILAVSKTNQQFLAKKYQREIKYLPNGVAIVDKDQNPLPEELNLENNNYFLMVARLIPVKCIPDVITAYQKLDTDKLLVIAGDSSFTDEYAQKIREMSKANPNIRFIGRQPPEVISILYSNAYLFILASSIEGLSIALLEAMSYECACLVSDIAANIEAVGEQGLTFKQGDCDDLEARFKYLLEHKKELQLNQLYSKERIKQYFDWTIIIKQMEQVYLKTIKG
ncbi:MAG: glycosyltransferase family 4 protein [Pseudomonadota bacterium]